MVRAARRDGFCAMFFAEAVRDEGFAKLHTRLWEIRLGRMSIVAVPVTAYNDFDDAVIGIAAHPMHL
jgi:hypothetical protein